MKLRARLSVAMLACALLPLLAAGLLARPALVRSFERNDARRREESVARVERSIRQRSDALAASLSRYCDNDPALARALGQLETRQFWAAARADLNDSLGPARTAMALDTLTLVRQGGEVLGSVGGTSAQGVRDETTFRLASRALSGATVRNVRAVRVNDQQGTRNVLVLEALCVAHRGAQSIAVAGGQSLEERIVGEAAEPGVAVAIASGTTAPATPSGGRVIPLQGDSGTATAWVVLTTNDEPLRLALHDVNNVLLLGAVFAACTALFLALFLAPRVARPILAVADAADQIARGDRSVRIAMEKGGGGETVRLVQAFNKMTRALESSDKRARRAERIAAWRDIARQMAHEIKNPLTPIQMAVEMLRKARERELPDFEELFDEQTRIVLEEVSRLRRLVEDFSRFARAPKPRIETVSLREIVAHVVGLHAGTSTEVTGEAERTLPAIRADREQLTQVLVNLVANACHAAEDRNRQQGGDPPAVHVAAVDLGDGRVRVTVDDNGPGIDPAVMTRLFEPYVTTKEGGTGLGLAVAYKIVHEHGGSITAETSPQGTRFELTLAIAGPPPDDPTLDTESRMSLRPGA